MTKFRSGFLAGMTLTAIVFLTVGAAVVRYETKTVAYREGLRITVNDEEVSFDAAPMIIDPGWIMCQLEPVVKKMGWLTEWDDANSTLVIQDYQHVAVSLGDSYYKLTLTANYEDWYKTSLEVASLIKEFEKNPKDQKVVDRLLDALTDLWLDSEVILAITPTPTFETAHKYLVMAMEETKLAVEDCRMWAKTLDWQAGRDGVAHLDKKALYLDAFETELQKLK